MKIIIVGAVAGGATAATRLRRIKEEALITIYERGNYVSFANCGLPYHIGEVISNRDSLILQTPDSLKSIFNFTVKVNHEVKSINPNNKTVKVKNLDTSEEFEDTYDYLLLSPGSQPIRPDIKGIELPNIFTLRNIPDMDSIISAISRGAKKAVVVGGGFIGLEMAENLHHQGLEVSMVEMLDQVLTSLDPDMASYVHQELLDNDIKLFLGEKVEGFEKNTEGQIEVLLSSGRRLTTDVVILAIGVKPEVVLAQEAGLTIGKSGGILVNEKMQTSNEFIYAVGDAVEVYHLVIGASTRIPLAGIANKQARVAANNIAGLPSTYEGALGTSIVKVFNLVCASTGANIRLLDQCQIPYKTAVIHPYQHAGYYPGASMMHIKLIYSPVEGKVLGAQVVGFDGIDKKIDVLATALINKATVYDLQNYELAYAPPFSSARDPINSLGFIAVNDITGFTPLIDTYSLKNCLNNNYFLLDVRNPEEVLAGKIPNSYNLPLHELRSRLNEIPRDKTIISYCKFGLRGYLAQRILIQNGFNAYNLSGGYDSFQAHFSQPETTIRRFSETITMEKPLTTNTFKVNACGLQCPGPLMKLKEAVSKAQVGEIIEIEASDPGFYKDVQSFATSLNLELLNLEKGKTIKASLKISDSKKEETLSTSYSNQVTIVVFSNDLDKAIAAFIIANGALAMGKNISMFFTFWGLNVLRKEGKVAVKKNIIEKMFGLMMPKGSRKLILSKMHMLGMGTGMIKWLMKSYNVDSLDTLIKSTIDNGGKLIACTMSMNLMGIKREELLEGIEEGGVATYLGDAEKGCINLFI